MLPGRLPEPSLELEDADVAAIASVTNDTRAAVTTNIVVVLRVVASVCARGLGASTAVVTTIASNGGNTGACGTTHISLLLLYTGLHKACAFT